MNPGLYGRSYRAVAVRRDSSSCCCCCCCCWRCCCCCCCCCCYHRCHCWCTFATITLNIPSSVAKRRGILQFSKIGDEPRERADQADGHLSIGSLESTPQLRALEIRNRTLIDYSANR